MDAPLRDEIYLHMPYKSLGDQICFLGAARIFVRRHREAGSRRLRAYVGVLPDVVNAYGDDLIQFVEEPPPGIHRVDVLCMERHRVKVASSDLTYVGTYLSALGLPFIDPPSFELPHVDPPAGLGSRQYIAIQPLSRFAPNPPQVREFAQALVVASRQLFPDHPVCCIGRAGTIQDLEGVNYEWLGSPLDVLRLVRHARYVMTPRSASAHIAAGARVPSFVWVPGDGEDWHLDYGHWVHARVSIHAPPHEAAAALRIFAASNALSAA